MARVLVVTPDVVPVGGRAATGAGLRAWGLGEGLRGAGHDVTYAMPRERADRALGADAGVLLYDERALDRLLAAHDPDVTVFQHWPAVGLLEEEHRGHLVIDFHGPLLLETIFRDAPSVEPLLPRKLAALRRADFFTCAAEPQVHYYAAHLLAAGFDLREPPLAVIPFSMPPELPERGDRPAPPVFVYGGVFLPWQDPLTGLRVLVEELERDGGGELRMFGGKHPWMNVGTDERFAALKEELEASPRVRMHGAVPRSELIGEYTSASVAWDLMAPNVERAMAFTSRTVEYLWCGLPVVYNDYAPLAAYIADADAGWTVDPDDPDAIRAVVREILADPDAVRRKGENARRLVRERLTWDRTIAPLDAFCRHPREPARLGDGLAAAPPEIDLRALVRQALLERAVRIAAPLPSPVRAVLRTAFRLVARTV